MQYKTHVMTSLAVSLPVMYLSNTLETPCVIAVCLGSLFPDIDEPGSWVGRRTRGVSDGIKFAFGHRGITHSLTLAVLVAIVAVLLSILIGFSTEIAIWFAIGYLLHIVEDSFSKSGVAWLRPFSRKYYQSGFGKVYYTTGSIVENLIFLAMLIIVVVEVFKFSDGTLQSILQGDIRSLFNN